MHQYTPIASALLGEPDAHQLFQNVANHYLACADNDYGSVDCVEGAPQSARIVWRLWMFLAEVGGGGVNDFLWNHCFKLTELQQIHSDLLSVEATSLRELLETGIRMAVEHEQGEFLEDTGGREWAGRFAKKHDVDTTAVDELSMAAAYPAGSEIVARFIRAHWAEL
jgi:hypothetical protein